MSNKNLENQQSSVSTYYDAVASDYSRVYQRQNLNTLEKYPANYFRLQTVVNVLASSGKKSVYEVGVGEGTPLLTLAKMGFEVAGCDISDSMVKSSQKAFEQAGLSPNLIHWGDIEDSTTLASQIIKQKFDAVIAAGVLPHISKEQVFFDNIKMILKPSGKALIEFRNKLFSLFTFNRHTKDFILNDLLANVSPDLKASLVPELDKRLNLDLPKPRNRPNEDISYDQILAKFHNPFELTEKFAQNGFTNIKLHWYHYHPVPPMLENINSELFRAEAFKLEHESSWRGYFLCSAGVVEADLA